MDNDAKLEASETIEYKCPECLKWVVPIDLLAGKMPSTEHEFIYGVCQCSECKNVLDWLSFYAIEEPRLFKQL